VNGVEALKAFEPAQRGSGTKTSVLAALVAWVFADRPEEGVVVSADYLGTDTDSIATMAGAVLGAAGAAPAELPGTVQDQNYLGLKLIACGLPQRAWRPPRFPYPDVLSWRPPRSGLDGVAEEDDQLHVVGLGPGNAVGEPHVTEGKTPGVWQWMQLWYGQTVLAKRRQHPTKLTSSHRVETSANYMQADLALRPDLAAEIAPRQVGGLTSRPSGRRPDHRDDDRRERHTQPSLGTVGNPRTTRSLDEITDDVIKAGLTDAAIGSGLREVVEHERSIESGQAFAAIIVKALAARARQPRSS
jgi:hypothetical protein